MADSKKMVVTQVTEVVATPQRNRSTPKTPPRSKSLFSVANGQSLRSQVSDLTLVLRWMIRTTYHAPSPTRFAVDYIVNPKLKNDRFVVGFGLPALAGTPRILSEAPSVRSSVSDWTYFGERTAQTRRKIINVASYNYLGNVDIKKDDRDLLERAIHSLALAGDRDDVRQVLEKEVEQELSQYFKMNGCVLTASGYSINLVAFPAMARSSLEGHGERLGPATVFLMDSESHSSMFVGAYIACARSGASIVKFKHNDVDDLRRKVDSVLSRQPSRDLRHLWVCIEGLYSMDGTVPPLPEILALKEVYGFRIYVDEAHSLFSLGHSGRGVVEHFQDTRKDSDEVVKISHDDIDLLGGTMSKSLSSVGGFVLYRQDLAVHVEARVTEMSTSEISSISTLSLIRTLQIIRVPHLIVDKLSNLHRISAYVASVLHAKGYNITTTPGGPFIALILDNVKRVLAFLRVGRELGLLCCGAAYPAAPRGAPRVRLSFTGAHTWQDAEDILRLIDDVSARVHVQRNAVRPDAIPSIGSVEKGMEVSTTDLSLNSDVDPWPTANRTALAPSPVPTLPETKEAKRVRQAGIDALRTYGLGAAGPRWMCGTTSAHMSLEQLLSHRVSRYVAASVVSKVKSNEITTTLFTDASVGFLSIVSVSMESLTNQRAKRGEKHLVFLPEDARVEFKEGAFSSSRHRSTFTSWYSGSDTKNARFKSIGASEEQGFPQALATMTKSHITLHIDTDLYHGQEPSLWSRELAEALTEILTPFQDRQYLSLTILIHDSGIFRTSFTTTQCILASLERNLPGIFSSRTTQWLLYSSLTTLPHVAGIQGAFATGSRRLIEKIQFLGPGVMYSAMMPSVNAAMAEESVRQILQSAV